MKIVIDVPTAAVGIALDDTGQFNVVVSGPGTDAALGRILSSCDAGGPSDATNHVSISREWLRRQAGEAGDAALHELIRAESEAMQRGLLSAGDQSIDVLTHWPVVEGTRIWDIVTSRVALSPDHEVACDERGKRMSFAQSAARAEEVAAALLIRGISAGDVVSWMIPTWLDALILTLALSRLRAIQNPIVPIYREREVAFCTEQTHSRMLIVPTTWRGFDYESMARDVARKTIGLDVLVVERDCLPSGDPSTLDPIDQRPDDGPHSVNWLMYTSGTTASPKGAKITDGSVSRVAREMCVRMDVRHEDRIALVFPFAHLGAITWMFGAWQYGFTLLMEEVFSGERTPYYLSHEGCTHAGTGTAFHLAYLKAQRDLGKERLFPRLKNCPGGGAPKPPQLHYDIKRELGGAGIISSWGLTEAQILTFCSPSDDDEKLANTEGSAMPDVELIVVDSEGRRVPTGVAGELRAKGPQVLEGYVDASLDADAFDGDGFFRTGDIGVIDSDGYVSITGRLKDVIIRNGENISAKELEDILYTHPKVGEVAIIGVPDAKTGERVCAVIATKGTEPPLSFAELRDFLLAARIRMQAFPEQLEIVESLPRNPSGKILKNALRETFRGSASEADKTRRINE